MATNDYATDPGLSAWLASLHEAQALRERQNLPPPAMVRERKDRKAPKVDPLADNELLFQLGNVFRRKRDALDLTKTAVAARAKTTLGSLLMIKVGAKRFSDTLLRRIAVALGGSLEEFLAEAARAKGMPS